MRAGRRFGVHFFELAFCIESILREGVICDLRAKEACTDGVASKCWVGTLSSEIQFWCSNWCPTLRVDASERGTAEHTQRLPNGEQMSI